MTNTEINKAIGAKLKAARRNCKLKGHEVASFLDITVQSVYNIERGRNLSSMEKIMWLCELYGVKFIDLMPEELKPLVA